MGSVVLAPLATELEEPLPADFELDEALLTTNPSGNKLVGLSLEVLAPPPQPTKVADKINALIKFNCFIVLTFLYYSLVIFFAGVNGE
jgi:hypothetical protein